jgi:hypothetical protein
MKGVIFTELVRFMEHAKSPNFSDDVIEQAAVASGGAYSSVGIIQQRKLWLWSEKQPSCPGLKLTNSAACLANISMAVS